MGEPILKYGMNPLKRRQEVVQRFVNKTLVDGKPRGKAMYVSTLPHSIFQYMKRNGAKLQSDHIFMPDKTILKYRNHPKAEKGAVLPHDEFWKIVNICGNPKNIYLDTHRNNLVFALTSRGEPGKVIKVIVEPNYKFNGKVVCAITSIGVVDKTKMGERLFMKIK